MKKKITYEHFLATLKGTSFFHTFTEGQLEDLEEKYSHADEVLLEKALRIVCQIEKAVQKRMDLLKTQDEVMKQFSTLKHNFLEKNSRAIELDNLEEELNKLK